MKQLLISMALACTAFPALACGLYTSDAKAPGERVLMDYVDELVLRDGNNQAHYATSNVGTGPGIRVAIPLEGGDALEISAEGDIFWFGPERFIKFCR